MLKTETWTEKSVVSMETSYGVVDSSNSEEMEITVGIFKDNPERGYFELYDVESGGERFYGEGGLWFDGKTLTDYDGVFQISNWVLKKLEEWGYDVSDF